MSASTLQFGKFVARHCGSSALSGILYDVVEPQHRSVTRPFTSGEEHIYAVALVEG